MYTITNPMPALRSRVEAAKAHVRNRAAAKAEHLLADFFKWALSKHSVQLVVADQFKRSTPLCGLLEDAVMNSLHEHEIEADSVRHLDRYVEEAIENLEIEPDNIRGLDRMVEEICDEMIKDQKRQVEADDIVGLEKMIEDAVSQQEVDTDNVNGLEDFVSNMLEKAVHEYDNNLGLTIEEKISELAFENSESFENAVCNAIAARLTVK